MDAHHMLATTRAVRKRLDFDRPVSREILLECLEVAVQAPTGSNSQGWQWVIVTDPEKKRVIGEVYKKSWYDYAKSGGRRYERDDPRRKQLPRVAASAQYLADRMHEVPVMVIPCIEGRVDRPGVSNLEIAGLYGSILPAAWSFMLAARARGLGTAWATLHLRYEREVANLLGLPWRRGRGGGADLGTAPGGERGGVRYRRAGPLGFRRAGEPCRLAVLSLVQYAGGLLVPFKDPPAVHQTYGAGRYLFDTAKDTDGLVLEITPGSPDVMIDFNYAYNASCAYSPRWACPLAPPENFLRVPVTAGELTYKQ